MNSSNPTNSRNSNNHTILLTIDVEDWFQVENFKECIPYSSWSSYELRVEKNTHRLLDLLDSIELQKTEYRGQETGDKINNIVSSNKNPVFSIKKPASNTKNPASSIQHPVSSRPRATFFVLGWLAERLPNLVREIYARGHEVASHGYGHDISTESPMEDLRKDLSKSKNIIEDIIENRVYGYRAPNFSIDNDILKAIQDCGYLYDSSYNSFSKHQRYGHLDLGENAKNGIAAKISDTFFELPISNIKIGNRIIPWGGGGYFRLIPYPIFKLGIKTILKRQNAYMIYVHPWEIDPEQPKIKDVSVGHHLRHYINLSKTHNRLTNLLSSFNNCKFITCREYLMAQDGSKRST